MKAVCSVDDNICVDFLQISLEEAEWTYDHNISNVDFSKMAVFVVILMYTSNTSSVMADTSVWELRKSNLSPNYDQLSTYRKLVFLI